MSEALENLHLPLDWRSRLDPQGCERIDLDVALPRLRETRLLGLGRPRIYETAAIDSVMAVDPKDLWSVQNYVCLDRIEAIADLRRFLLTKDLDLLRLDCAVRLRLRRSDAGLPDLKVIVPPPIVERWGQDGKLRDILSDGTHRVCLALRLGVRLSIIRVHNIPTQYPHYAYPIESGWSGVQVVESVPMSKNRRTYRAPSTPKALFRDYVSALCNV